MSEQRPPPEKLSELIQLAIADTRSLDRDNYRPTWTTWHAPHADNGRCMICVAGGAIAGTLGYPADTTIALAERDLNDPFSTRIADRRWRNALKAIGAASAGEWKRAFRTLHGHVPDEELCERLDEIPKPADARFENWAALDNHLGSLEDGARRLHEMGL